MKKYSDIQVTGSMLVTGSLNVDGITTISGIIEATSSQAVTSISSSIATNYEGAWISYTPTWEAEGTNPTIGNGTLVGAYKLIGKTCHMTYRLILGSTSNPGSGMYFFGLPFTAKDFYSIQFGASMLNTGIAWYHGIVNGSYIGNPNKVAVMFQGADTNVCSAITHLAPFAWGEGDQVLFSGTYEIA